MPITVVIADDQAMVRQGFGALLGAQSDISVVGDASNGSIAVEEVARLRGAQGLHHLTMVTLALS